MTEDVTKNEALDKFLEERSKIPIPSGDVARVKLLAKELALGIHRELWDPIIIIVGSDTVVGEYHAITGCLDEYLERRWGDNNIGHKLHLLRGYGYIEDIHSASGRSSPRIAQSAFDLLDEIEPYNVFISYKRSESSALALLVLARLKEHSLVPFVDMALEVGGNWHADLEERIKACDYFIVLLGKETLSSPMTVKEVLWAFDSKRTIIPIWHNEFGQENGFKLRQHIEDMSGNWDDDGLRERKDEVHDVFRQTNAIIVQDESASGYNTAIVELLGRFGVMP